MFGQATQPRDLAGRQRSGHTNVGSACRATCANPYCSDGPGLPVFRPNPRSSACRGGASGRQQARLRASGLRARPASFGRRRVAGARDSSGASASIMSEPTTRPTIISPACPTMRSWPTRRARRRATGRPGRWGSILGRRSGLKSGRTGPARPWTTLSACSTTAMASAGPTRSRARGPPPQDPGTARARDARSPRVRDGKRDQGALQDSREAAPSGRQRRRPIERRQIARDHPGL